MPRVPSGTANLMAAETREGTSWSGFVERSPLPPAGSGIGQALAIELARSGAKVAISDVDTDGLADTEHRPKATSSRSRRDRLDVTEREAFLAYADAVNEHSRHCEPDLQQRRYRLYRLYRGQPSADIERVMDVDFWGVA